MEINATGIFKGELTDYLSFWTDKLREVYGNNFNIKKEGLIDNVATASSLTSLALEDVMLYLAKQLNPMTAEGEFQDILYSYIGLERRYADFTVVTRTISGSANLVCQAGSIRFKNNSTDDIFSLNTTVTLDENGIGVGSFTAIELGSIDLKPTDNTSIIDAPEGVNAVYYSEGNVTNIGDDYEDDSEFRLRWLATKSVLPTSKTEGGLRTALLDLVENDKDLVIRQNRGLYTHTDLPLHTINIILKSAYSPEVIAQKILDHFTDGVGIAGVGDDVTGFDTDLNKTVTLKDSEGTDIDIIYTEAEPQDISFKVVVKEKDGYVIEEDSIKNAIIDNFNYVLGEKIIANDFYKYLNDLEFVDYIDSLGARVGDSGNYTNVVPLAFWQYGIVNSADIKIESVE